MNVKTLRSLLEGYDDETQVMIAHQPSWPLAEVVASIVADSERDRSSLEEEADDDEPADPDCVWIVAGGHDHRRSAYAPRDVFESNNW